MGLLILRVLQSEIHFVNTNPGSLPTEPPCLHSAIVLWAKNKKRQTYHHLFKLKQKEYFDNELFAHFCPPHFHFQVHQFIVVSLLICLDTDFFKWNTVKFSKGSKAFYLVSTPTCFCWVSCPLYSHSANLFSSCIQTAPIAAVVHMNQNCIGPNRDRFDSYAICMRLRFFWSVHGVSSSVPSASA